MTLELAADSLPAASRAVTVKVPLDPAARPVTRALVPLDALAIVGGPEGPRSARELFGYQAGWGMPPVLDADAARIVA